MQIGFVGLGRMGAGMSRRLLGAGHAVVVTNRSPERIVPLVADGAIGTADLAALVAALERPRAVWLMLPPGAPTEDQISALRGLLSPGDIIVEGGNSNFHDDIRRVAELALLGIGYLDVGTSGGIFGLANGYSLMVGGKKSDYDRLTPIFAALAPVGGQMYCGGPGAGHYAKMVHNGIEYGLMEAYAEGFELLAASGYEMDLAALAGVWNHGSVIRSWLLELLEDAITKDPQLSAIKGYVEDTGEGRWTAIEGIERAVPMPVLLAALDARFRSRQKDSFAMRMLAAMRNEFGGHAVKPADGVKK